MTKQAASLSIRGESEFLRRNNSRDLNRRKRIRSVTVKGGHLFLVALILILLAFLIYRGAGFLLSWEQLNVRTVRIVNRPAQGMDRVRSLIKQVNGNILALSLDHLREELARINQVRDVSISRVLPSTVEINFRLREPVYQVESKGAYYVLDDEGVLLYRREQRQQGLLTLKGVGVTDVSGLIPQLRNLSGLSGQLEYVEHRKPFGVMLKFVDLAELIYPGSEDIRDKIQTYLELRDKLVARNGPVRIADLRFKDRFYLEFAQEGDR